MDVIQEAGELSQRHGVTGVPFFIINQKVTLSGAQQAETFLEAFRSIPLLGKLPGDIRIERENFRFYFPLTTCILLSLLLTGVMWLVRYFSQ
jgi:hypothetical protein